MTQSSPARNSMSGTKICGWLWMPGDEARKKLASMKAVALLGPLTVRLQRVNSGAMKVPTVAAMMP